MLALTGAAGDGWLPTMEYLPAGPGSLPEANDRIDQAAAAAGRAPAAVRRLMNIMRAEFAPTTRGLLEGPPAAWRPRCGRWWSASAGSAPWRRRFACCA